MSAIDAWFGDAAGQLHPLLRALHSHGGRLDGDVALRLPSNGLGRLLGRRLLRRMGLSADARTARMTVEVVPEDGAYTWTRRVDGGPPLVSRFTPVGRYPTGYWRETTGALELRLGVELVHGGWRWTPAGAYLRHRRLPDALAPRVRGAKWIEDDRYAFDVAIALPGVGVVLDYSGCLAIDIA